MRSLQDLSKKPLCDATVVRRAFLYVAYRLNEAMPGIILLSEKEAKEQAAVVQEMEEIARRRNDG